MLTLNASSVIIVVVATKARERGLEMTIGEKIKHYRLKANKTQEQVAKELDISRSALNSYELGQRVPRDAVKIKLSNYFGISIEELFF